LAAPLRKINITKHAVERAVERLGELYCGEKKVKDSNEEEIKAFIKNHIYLKTKDIKYDDSYTAILINDVFTAIAVVNKRNLDILTVIYSGQLIYPIYDILTEKKRAMIMEKVVNPGRMKLNAS